MSLWVDQLYVVIFSDDDGATWQFVDGYDDTDAALIALRTAQAEHPARRYEMHCLHPRLYAAVTGRAA